MSKPAFAKPLPNLVIRASAGSGKTFRLTNRYLELAGRGVPLERILATTFTRKAAGEILARVLTRLAAAADDDAERERLAQWIAGDKRPFDRAACLELLAYLASHLHRLRIGTLDSLFGQMARAFALELNLPPGWSIADDAENVALRNDAIADLLAARETGDVTRMVHLLSKGSNEQSVVRLVDSAVSGLFSLYQETSRDAWHQLPRRKALEGRALETALEELARAGLPEDKRAAAAREKDHAAALRGDWDTFLSKGLTARVAAGENTYYKKELPADLVAAYATLIDHAAALIINRIAAQTEGTYELLERFDEHFARLQQSRRLLRFEDITRRLGKWTASLTSGDDGSSRELELLAFRLDARIDHLLLDEFQDTSLAQWQVLRPIAQHVTSAPARGVAPDADGSTSFFCVGDPKQAIYAWRGGMAEIFAALDHQLTRLSKETLAESRRSAPAVIETVNRVFQTARDRLALERGAVAFDTWCAQFPEHSTARTGLPGYVTLETPPELAEDDESTDADPVIEFTAKRISELVKSAPGHSIGVLMRSNAGIARMIHALRQLQVPASEEGGNPPTDSAAVQLIVSALRLADHPGDRIARFHLVHSPLGEVLGLTSSEDDKVAAAVSREIRRGLVELGYGAVFERWMEKLLPHVSARDARRLEQVTELAYRRHAQLTLRPGDFVRLLELTRMPDASLVDVRVTTIHQAKGLEYDIVVLPELTGALCGQPDSIAVGRSQPAGPIDTVCRYVNSSLQALLPKRFQKLFADQENANVEESLCVLYVALTRAVHALHMIVPASKDSEKKLPATFAGVLRASLTDGAPLPPESQAYKHGNPDWAKIVRDSRGVKPGVADATSPSTTPATPPLAPATESSGTIRLAERQGPRKRGLDRVAPSTLEGGSTRRLADSLRAGPSRAKQRGTLVHAWCERLEWLDRQMPSDGELRDIALRTQDLAWPPDELTQLIEDFHESLASDEILRGLRRDAYPASAAVELLREHRFAVRQDDELLSGSIDRLVLVRDGQRVQAAEILDYKTDSVPAGDDGALAKRVAFYRPQMLAYRSAISRAYQLEPANITLRLLFLSARRAVTLDGP